MRRIAIRPSDRLRGFVVVPDVATNLAGQIGDGREGSPREQVALDLGKPEFDLVGCHGRQIAPTFGRCRLAATDGRLWRDESSLSVFSGCSSPRLGIIKQVLGPHCDGTEGSRA